MALQGTGRATRTNRALQLYINVRLASDSQFPLCGDDEYVVRVVDEAVVITPPDYDPDRIDLPAIDPTLKRS